MHATWIRGVDDVLIRSDIVTLLRNNTEGLFAETLTGRVVQLTRTDCPSTTQLALLEEIRSSESADGRLTSVIIAVEAKGRAEWLIDLILNHGSTSS
jgi:hypothetical protein